MFGDFDFVMGFFDEVVEFQLEEGNCFVDWYVEFEFVVGYVMFVGFDCQCCFLIVVYVDLYVVVVYGKDIGLMDMRVFVGFGFLLIVVYQKFLFDFFGYMISIFLFVVVGFVIG